MKSNIAKFVKLQRLPYTLMLSSSLILSACSNSDPDNIAIDADDVPVVVDDAVTTDTAVLEDNALGDMATASDQTSMPSPSAIPAPPLADQPSIVTNMTEPNSPEDTVKQALNTLYYGDVEDAVGYYQVDMANFEQELANTQSAFQQTVDSVTITDTQYSEDDTVATIEGELMIKGQSEPAPLTYQLKKVNGQWKILG
ncbi:MULTISPECIES: nuclear transport factor 2 family protein [unclassified Psychrobacter]|uniref:hypothetical protein n=2 Tax=Psychrobacter TaxID=497 RepID=UPI003FCFC8FC